MGLAGLPGVAVAVRPVLTLDEGDRFLERGSILIEGNTIREVGAVARRKADRVMALAGGESKTKAIAGALKLGVVDVLVTDKFTAARLTA